MINFKKIIKNSFLYKPLKKWQSFFVSFRVNKNLKKIKKDGNAVMPDTIVFEPTVKCNLDCKMCYQKKERSLADKDLSFEQIKKIFLKLKKKNKNFRYVSMIGAEVFMRPDLMDIIGFLESIKLKVYLATNGTLVTEEKVEQLKRFKNILGIGYSLDGLKEDHNKIRGREYAFDKLMNAINLTKDHFILTINSVVMTSNVDRIYEIGKFVKEIGISNYALQFEMASTKDEVEVSSECLFVDREFFSVEEKEDTIYGFSKEKILGIIKKLRNRKGLNVSIQPGVFEKYPGLYLEGRLGEEKKLFCKDVNSVRVSARGDVIFCPFIKKSFGNLLEKSFSEIWNCEEFKDFRLRLLKNNLAPVCKQCCRLGIWE